MRQIGSHSVMRASSLPLLCVVVAFCAATTRDVQTLDADNFEHLTQATTGATTGDWLVLFASFVKRVHFFLRVAILCARVGSELEVQRKRTRSDERVV